MQKQNETNENSYSLRCKILAIIIFLALIVFSFLLYLDRSSYKSSETVIYKAAAQVLNKKPDELNKEDFSKLTELDLKGTLLYDIRPLLKFPNLKKLNLGKVYGPKIELPKWKAVLVKLRLLNISQRITVNIRPLKKLTALESLDLTGREIKKTDTLSNLINLRELILKDTDIANLEPVKQLKNLQKLDLAFSKVCNLEPLKELTNLQKLDFWGNKVDDLEPLRNLTNLRSLIIYSTSVSNLEPIKELNDLEELWIDADLLTKVEFKNFRNMKRLGLFNNIRSIDGKKLMDLKNSMPNLEIVAR